MDRFELFLSGIHSIYRNIQQIKSAEMEELGLKGTHFLCLYYLHKSEIPLTPVQLSKKKILFFMKKQQKNVVIAMHYL